MKQEPTSYYVNNVVPLKESVKEFLRVKNPEDYDASRKISKCRIQGGVLSNIRYSWLCRGPKLEIIHTKTGSKVAAWSFGSVVHDFETIITCVTELPSVQGKLPNLIVGLECEIGGGMICVFDVNSSRVIRAIQIDDRVTTIHVVNPGCDTSFPGALRAMDGVLAVGTGKGKIILIDLCRQICEEAVVNVGPEYVRDEINACHLIYLSFMDLNNLEMHKERSLNSGDHLALQINEPSTSGVHFALHGPNGEVRLHANMEEVAISSLHYCPQLGSLFVGFNFGAFQIYNLLNIQLEYTSPVYEDCIPITHFAIQEPCDDPRAFCYVWVVYNIVENGDNGFPMAVMYALAYDTKDFLEGYGHLYQEFNSCSVRFQIELSAVPGFRLALNKSEACSGARCISLNAYSKAVVNRQYGAVQDVPDDKLALCSIVWIAWNQNMSASETYLTLFDLNQWYKEQMPSTTRLENDALSYMSCESLSDLFGLSTDDVLNSNLLDVRLNGGSLSPFVCAQRLEEHYYPWALAFEAVCVQEAHVVWVGNEGAQRHLLTQLELAGPLRLVRPTDLFHRCISLGLTPLYTDAVYSVSTPVRQQREMILSVALEQQLVRWLCRCARDWANGSHALGGCTLDTLLEWAWQRANTLKFQSDKLCVPLFDHAGARPDANALLHLNHCTCQIKHLTTLFETVVLKCTQFLNEQDIEDIKYQWRALQMISTYLEVLQWLLNVGLLPECPLSMYPRPDEADKMSAPYPAESLACFYEKRRGELKTFTDNKNNVSDDDALLFIDKLIDVECKGGIVHVQWECDGGNGMYPPPSLQAVLRAYLIEDVDIVHKHCLLIYLFLDLAMTLDQSRYAPIIAHLIKFPAVFKLSPSLIKITQAFWQLDHGDFSTAMTQLLDPSLDNHHLKPWHHRLVLRALLLQGQHQHALLYQQVRKPPVSNVQDICIIITLLVVNDLLQEAFHLQRHNRSPLNEAQILRHLFTVCDSTNQLAAVLHLPLCPVEEREFVEYLRAHPNDNNHNFLVIYYLQRDRYAEAFQINDRLNAADAQITKQGLLGQHHKTFRNAIVTGFKKTLPHVTQQLLDYCKREKDHFIICTNVDRPVPMSVCVHDTTGQTKYKSTLIQASFQKAKELWSTTLQSANIENNLNNTPFISTPKIFQFSPGRKDSSIIYPAIVDASNMEIMCDDMDEGATPAKRIKLSPRRSINDQFKKRLSCYNSDSLLSTPIVKRRSIRDQFENSAVGTPPSILKVRPPVRHSVSPEQKIRETSTTPEIIETGTPVMRPQREKRTSFGISPRKAIVRTPRPAVHFEERPSSQSSNEGIEGAEGGAQIQIEIEVHREQTPDIDSKNSSRSTDDVFYSPNSSINLSDNQQQQQQEDQSNIEKTPSINESINGSVERSSLKRKANDSVSSRRSYKPATLAIPTTPATLATSATPTTLATPTATTKNTSVRESLKSRRSIAKNTEPEKTSTKETNIKIIVTEATPTPSEKTTRTSARASTSKNERTPETTPSPKIVPKVSGRRSLSRQVLENNLFAKVVAPPSQPSPPRMNTRLSATKLSDADKKRGVEVSYSRSTTSIVKVISDEKVEERCDLKMVETKDEFSTERNADDNTTQIIKHVHNHMETKSNVTKVTELVDDDNYENSENSGNSGNIKKDTKHFEEMNVLSFNSDISDSEVAHFYENIPQALTQKRYSVLLSTSDSDKNTTKTNQDETQEQLEIESEEQEKTSDQSDNDDDDDEKIEENKDETTNSHDEDEEMKQTHVDETNKEKPEEEEETEEEEKISNQDDEEDEINISDDLAENEEPQENMDYDQLNSEESEEENQEQTIPDEEAEAEEEARTASSTSSSSSSEDSSQSQSSDIILIKSSSDDHSSDNSNSSSEKTQLLQQNNYNKDDAVDDDVDENASEQSEEINKTTNDENELVQVEIINEDNNTTTEENFKLTLDESNEEEQSTKLTLNESVEKETTLNNEPIEKEETKKTEIMEDINEDNMDTNNEFFINEDIEEMENVEYITEKSNNSESQNSQINTLAKIQEEEQMQQLYETMAQSQQKESTIAAGNNVIDLLESIVDEEKEQTQQKDDETIEDINPLEQNVIQISDTTIKPQENEESEEIETTIKPQENEKNTLPTTEETDVTVNPLEQNVIEITETTINPHENEDTTIQTEEIEVTIETTIKPHENKESIIQTEEIEVTVDPLEQNVIEINDTTINPSGNESSLQIEETEVTVDPLEQNVIEISESTIKHQETTIQDEEMDTSTNPLELNVIEISESTIKPTENEESIIQIEDATINPLEQNVIDISSPKEKSPKSEMQTPARRTRSASQHSETKKTPTRSSTRRRSIDQKIEEEPREKPAQRITKKRSGSVDTEDKPTEEETKTINTRTRRKSIDDTPRKTRASSVINLEVIEEDKPMSRTRRAASVDPKSETDKSHQRRGQSLEPETTTTIAKRGKKRALQPDTVTQEQLQSIPEKIEEYSATHRLTRHQKSIMEKSLVNQQKSRLQQLKEVEEIDPINLLDKESFTGSPDKEEGTYREISPASSISTQSSAAIIENTSPGTPKRKRGRPSLSGTPGSSTNTEGTHRSPGRPRRRSFTQAQQTIAATTPPRTRRSSRTASQDQDDAASVVSVSSVMSVPVVQIQKLSEKDLVRHRSLSPTALKEETATTKNRRRSTRSSVIPTNLSKISEETNADSNEEKPRRGRHRKTEAEGTSSQSELPDRDSGLKKTQRRSYKPLQNYLPEHAVVKTRKTFKIKKYSRGGSSSP